jgi:hypothetical protein
MTPSNSFMLGNGVTTEDTFSDPDISEKFLEMLGLTLNSPICYFCCYFLFSIWG